MRAPLVPRNSLLGWAVWACVLGLGFQLRLATPGWGVGLWVCMSARSACSPPLLAGLCAVGVCAWARALAAPCHSWLGCWGVCVFVCALRLYPLLLAGVCGVAVCAWARVSAAPRQSWLACWGPCVFMCAPRLYPPLLTGVCGVGVCAWAPGFGCAPPLLAGVFGCVCVFVRAPLVPCHSWLGCAVWVCVCLRSGLGCAPSLLAGVLRCVCVCVRAPLVPRHSWPGCAVCLSVLWLEIGLHPATRGWDVGVRVCLCVCSACSPALLAGLCGVGVYAWARVLAAPRHSWLGC